VLNLAELERRWGPGEGQPGPRVTYAAGNHPGLFFWVYYYKPQKTGKLIEEDTFVHHIVRADAIEERGTVVWPEAMMRESAAAAGAELAGVYRENGAKSPAR
jgi:hypothetical protein